MASTENSIIRSNNSDSSALLGPYVQSQTVAELNAFDIEEIEMNDEYEMELELEKLTATLERHRGQDKTMKIGKNKFQLNDKDPIYFRNGPNRKQVRTGACVSCIDHIFESNSKIQFCQFCGQNNCEECLYKERMFPRGRINAEG